MRTWNQHCLGDEIGVRSSDMPAEEAMLTVIDWLPTKAVVLFILVSLIRTSISGCAPHDVTSLSI